MAHDKTEPRTRLISALALFVVVCVVLVRYGLISYWNVMQDEEMDRKVNQRPAAQLLRLREDANRRLTGGAMPIDQAMTTIANGQRPAAIGPRPSTDMAPLTGWMQNVRPLPTEMPMAPPVTPEPLPVPEVADGGVPGLEALTAPGQVQNPHPMNAGVVPPHTAPAH